MLVLVLVMIFILQSTKVAAETNSLFYEGKDFTVELLFTNKANIFENATLSVTEFYEGSEEYQDYYSQTNEFIKENMENEIAYVRFFDICIMEGEMEIEPDDTVQVSIKYDEGVEKTEESELSVVHFSEDGNTEVVEIQDEVIRNDVVSQISFEEDSFSVFGMIILDGIDTSVKNPGSEIITNMISIDVCKEWSDGYEVHEKDSVTISLYEVEEENWTKCDEIVLSHNNDWKGKFDNLDRSKEYGVRETKVISGKEEVKATYQSTITDTGTKAWCLKEKNELKNGEEISLVFDDDKTRLLRKSSDTNTMDLRNTGINISIHSIYGEYCTHNIASYEVWKSIWNEEHEAWEIYTVYGDAYLSLVYDSSKDIYQWKTVREKTEGSYLNYEDGMISATVNGVTKYLGNIVTDSTFTGLDEGDSGIEEFRIYTYRIFKPGKIIITNTKNENLEEKKIEADVITGKQIDYLGDGQNNPDTDADDDTGRMDFEKVRKDLYRLNLELEMKTDATGLDLLLVIDVSSSMKANNDCKDADGNKILRSEALRQALNQFIPKILPENTKNRVSIVAFENETMILQDWTQDADEVLEKVNYEVDGQMPLYNGGGTNYEAALIRANEALTKRGYSGNAKAMIFLSDGEPTTYVFGNDYLEAGNVTVDLGTSTLTANGIEGELPRPMWNVWISNNEEDVLKYSNEAIRSFKNHNPEIMVGTIAFNTVITDCLRDLATDQKFVTQIENGTPNDLIKAMELITDFVPKEICVVDELSEYVDLYENNPDWKIVSLNKENKETILYNPETGLTKDGEKVLDKESPLEVAGKLVRINFQKDYLVEDGCKYMFSFNVSTSQRAYNELADERGIYPHTGDDKTDYKENATSALIEGFYSNGENTKVQYSMNGATTEKKYRKPVVQAQEGSFSLKKTDLDGNNISEGAEFTLYREADESEKDGMFLEGMETKVIKAAEGVTDENGEITFEHLRLSVFDTGYPYYLVETKAPEGYVENEEIIRINLFSDRVETPENPWCYVDENGKLIVRNAEYVENIDIPVTGGNGSKGFYMIGIMLITGGIYMFKKNRFSRFIMMLMALLMGCHMAPKTAFAINNTDKGSVTVNGVEEYVTVSAYRMMDINFDYDVNQPKNPMYMWADGAAEWMNTNYPEFIDTDNHNAVKEEFSEADEVKVAELYDKLAVAIKDGTVVVEGKEVMAEDDETAVVIDNLTMGNYFILIEGGLNVYRPLSANVVPEFKDGVWKMTNPEVSAKASSPSITKEITGGLKEDNADIGDTISFELNAVIPSYPEHAKAKMFVVSDKLSEGLTLVEDSLKIYGVNSGKSNVLIESGFTRSKERSVNANDLYNPEDKIVSFALDFDYSAISEYESLKITYDALLNEKSVVGEAGNGNIALLDYSSNPYSANSYSTDGDETTVYTYGMKISKVDEDTNAGLSGAEFTLSKDGQEISFVGENGVYHVAAAGETGNKTVVVDGNGLLTLNGLDAGTYSLTETKAPDGYVKLQNSVEIVISDSDMNGKVESDGQELSDGYMPVTVKNDTGFTLPVTGGMGTTLFNVAGIALVGSGLLLIVTYFRKRRNYR